MPSIPMLKLAQSELSFRVTNLSLSAICTLGAFCALSLTLVIPAASAQTKKSATDNSTTFTIYAAGDIADCRKLSALETNAAKTATLIASGLQKNKNAYAMTLGDNTYPIGKPEEFNDCYDKTWGQFKTRTLPSPGNHDYGVPLAAGYYHYFDELAGTKRLGYYKKRLGNWLILSLNSNIKNQAMQAQLAWLKSTLKDNPSTCTLAFWHHPVYSSGGHGNNKTMRDAWEILADAKADIVLSGHDHHYERFTTIDKDGSPNSEYGIRSFVVGTGGAKLSPVFLVKDGSEFRQNDHHGVLKLNLANNSYAWEFISADNNQVLDKGQASCQ
jgi:hypothetical protein